MATVMATDALLIPTGDGQIQKIEVDYSSTVAEKVPACEDMAAHGKLTEALEILMALEKQTRTGADTHSTSKVLVAMVKICFDNNNSDLLNETIVLLTKRRGQIKQSVTKMIQEACTFVEKITNLPEKLKLIDTLRTVTAGKIYVEIERARLTRTLAKIKEDGGDVIEAANILQELQVETFGSMDKKEKVEFILEQMRLCLAKKDFIRTQIISKKISPKYFEGDGTKDLKLKFYKLMIELDEHEGSYLAICRHYKAIYDTPDIQADVERMKEALKCVVLYVILSPYDNEQSDLINRLKEDKNLEQVPKYKELLKMFTTTELIQWRDLCMRYEGELKTGTPANPATHIYAKNESGAKRWTDTKSRVVEHNMRVLAQYYTRVRMRRIAELLDLTEAEAEEFLSNLVVNKTVSAKIDCLDGIVTFTQLKDPNEILNDWSHDVTISSAIRRYRCKTTYCQNHEAEEFLSNLVVNKTVSAKIDRLDGIVTFTQLKDPNEILNDWSHDVTNLMKLVNKTNHLITKEEMVHKFR